MQIAAASLAPTPASSASPSTSIAAPDLSAESPPSAPPAVSVTLSSGATQALAATPAAQTRVQIPPAVLAEMAAFETTSPTAYTDQVNQYANTINDTKASDQDRLDAWTALGRMLTSGTICKAGNVADLQTALDAEQTSPYAQSLMQLQDQFNTTQVNNLAAARAKGGSGAQSLLDSINSYSSADQQKIFVLFGLNLNYSDLNTMKADYQQVADTYAATGQLTKATMQLPATSATANAQGPTAPASPAQTLPAAVSDASSSDVALTLLQNGVAHAAKVAAEANGGAAKASTAVRNSAPSGTGQPYQQGSALSLVA